jgi:hypothetical protein
MDREVEGIPKGSLTQIYSPVGITAYCPVRVQENSSYNAGLIQLFSPKECATYIHLGGFLGCQSVADNAAACLKSFC